MQLCNLLYFEWSIQVGTHNCNTKPLISSTLIFVFDQNSGDANYATLYFGVILFLNVVALFTYYYTTTNKLARSESTERTESTELVSRQRDANYSTIDNRDISNSSSYSNIVDLDRSAEESSYVVSSLQYRPKRGKSVEVYEVFLRLREYLFILMGTFVVTMSYFPALETDFFSCLSPTYDAAYVEQVNTPTTPF